MKEKMKIFLKKLKNILPLLLACLLVGAMVLGLYLFSQSKQVKTLSASAEEASTVAETESVLDLTQYPSANLLPYPYKDTTKTIGGVTYTDNGNGSISLIGSVSVNGTSTGISEFLLYSSSSFLPVGTYTYKVYNLPEGVSANFQFYDGYSWVKNVASDDGEGATFTITEDDLMYRFQINLYIYKKNMTFDGLTLYPMLNAGDIAYPFIPSLDGIYGKGYEAGETDGKEIGYSDGLDKARAGYWNDSKVYVNLNGTSNGATVNDYLEITPTITSNGVDLSNVYTEINAKYPNFIATDTTFGFDFVSPVYFDGLTVRCIGDTSVLVDREMIAIVYDPKTKKESGVDCRFILIDGSDNVAGFQTATTREELFGKQLKSFGTFTVQNISQFKNMRFYSNEVIANLNYQAGYQAGVLDNTLYQKGYDKGFELGEKKGFDEGVIKGQTNDPYDLGDFLFSIIDAPFRVIREALNFEILGYDVSEIVFFLLSAGVFMFVLKKIKGD